MQIEKHRSIDCVFQGLLYVLEWEVCKTRVDQHLLAQNARGRTLTAFPDGWYRMASAPGGSSKSGRPPDQALRPPSSSIGNPRDPGFGLPIGTQFGRYLILEEIGKGEFSVVYRTTRLAGGDGGEDQEVALKVLRGSGDDPVYLNMRSKLYLVWLRPLRQHRSSSSSRHGRNRAVGATAWPRRLSALWAAWRA